MFASSTNTPTKESLQQRKRRWLASFLLVFMSFQYVLLEGPLISWPKIVVMAISPFALAALGCTRFSAGMFLGIAYYLTICLTSFIHPYKVSHISIYYTIPFILVFGSYHTLLSYNVFKREDFERILLSVMYAYIICLLLQQACYFAGIHKILLFNRWKPLGFKFQSLGLEPSYASRIFFPYAFAYLEMIRLKHGKELSLRLLWQQYRVPIIGILYFFITLGSGYGWGCLVFLGAYIGWNGHKFLSLIFLVMLFCIPTETIEAKDRMIATVNATMTMNMDNVIHADHSASSRISVFFAFFNNFKPLSTIFWFGQGHYQWLQPNVGIIQIYGFIAWLVQLILLRICAFRRFLSFEFLYFIVFMGMCIGNVVNLWAIAMVFSTLKYFYATERKNLIL